MKDRIKKIMESQKMTQQEFSDYIKIAPATLSSIFTGRTRPSLSVVEAIKNRFRDISTDWLMFGVGPMFKTVDVAAGQHGNESAKRGQDNGLTVDFSDAPSASLYGNDAPLPYGASDGSDGQMTSDEAGMEANGSKEGKVVVVKKCDKPQRRISEIRIFYDDQTWETFVPKDRS